jgi:hypothetical protein
LTPDESGISSQELNAVYFAGTDCGG